LAKEKNILTSEEAERAEAEFAKLLESLTPDPDAIEELFCQKPLANEATTAVAR
jgi:hypothetical protein